jgi:hypothetical protein
MSSQHYPIPFRMIFWPRRFIPDLLISKDGKYRISFFRDIVQKLKNGGMNNLRREQTGFDPTFCGMNGRMD